MKIKEPQNSFIPKIVRIFILAIIIVWGFISEVRANELKTTEVTCRSRFGYFSPNSIKLSLSQDSKTLRIVGDIENSVGNKVTLSQLAYMKNLKGYEFFDGVTLYTELLGYQETYEGFGIVDGGAIVGIKKNLINDQFATQNKKSNMVILYVNDDNELDMIRFVCNRP